MNNSNKKNYPSLRKILVLVILLLFLCFCLYSLPGIKKLAELDPNVPEYLDTTSSNTLFLEITFSRNPAGSERCPIDEIIEVAFPCYITSEPYPQEVTFIISHITPELLPVLKDLFDEIEYIEPADITVKKRRVFSTKEEGKKWAICFLADVRERLKDFSRLPRRILSGTAFFELNRDGTTRIGNDKPISVPIKK